MELRDYARGLRRHWLAIVLMVILGVGVAYGWVQLQTPVYEASASGIAKSQQAASQEQNLFYGGDPAAEAQMPAILQIAGWREVAQSVIDDMGLETTPEELVTRVTVLNPESTTIIEVLAKGPTATDARALAESWLRGLTQALDENFGDGTPGSAPVNLVLGDAASLPSSPLFPDLRTSLIVGAVIGLGFGVGFALLRTASDRRVRAFDEVEAKTGVSVVGTIPLAKRSGPDDRLFDPDPVNDQTGFAIAEAIRALRTNLQFMDVDNPPRTIVVTSPLPGDGKSTIACNLALTLAASGTNVVLVDGDLRRSKVALTMGLSGSAGLSDVLAGRAAVAEVLQRAPQSANLWVLAAGSAPPNPSEVLGSVRMKALLEELAEHATVIVDAPPILPVTDGAVLAHQSDGAIVVVSVGKTTYDLVDKAIETLEKARGRALGIVLNKVPMKGADASSYSYQYRREYRDQSKGADVRSVVPSTASGSARTGPSRSSNVVEDPNDDAGTDGSASSLDALVPQEVNGSVVNSGAARRRQRAN